MATTEERPDLDEGRMSLVEHLTELRDRLIKCVVAIVLGAVAGFLAYKYTFDFLIDPYQKICEANPDRQAVGECRLLVNDPLQGFSVRLKVSGYTGLALAMPVILWQLWRFITPGLYAHEKRYAVPFVASALVLFVMGAGIAYWTLPKALGFLQTIGGEDLVQAYTPDKYFQLIVYMMLAFGAGFEFPILLIFLQMAGILSTARLREWRRYAVVVIFVIVAVVTPSADPISLFALAVPMTIFYEIAILVGRIRERRARSDA